MLPKFALLALLGLFLASHITTAEGRIKQKCSYFFDSSFLVTVCTLTLQTSSFIDYYRFMHHGHCKDGYACNNQNPMANPTDCNTKEETIVNCRNTCERLGKDGFYQAFGIEIGYFTYAPGSQKCACYAKDEKCGDDGNI